MPMAKAIEWTEEMLSALGKISDLDFADKFNVTEGTIKKKRKELGIPGYKPKPIAWNKFADVFMVSSDEQIASVLDMHPITIRRKRVSLINQGFLDECFDSVPLNNKAAIPRIKELAAYIRHNEDNAKARAPKQAPPVYQRKIARTKLSAKRRRPPATNFPKELIVAKVKRYPHTALLFSNRSKKPLREFCEQMSGYCPSGAGFNASLKTMRAWGFDVNERWEILRHFVQRGIDTDKALLRYLEQKHGTNTTNRATRLTCKAS